MSSPHGILDQWFILYKQWLLLRIASSLCLFEHTNSKYAYTGNRKGFNQLAKVVLVISATNFICFH